LQPLRRRPGSEQVRRGERQEEAGDTRGCDGMWRDTNTLAATHTHTYIRTHACTHAHTYTHTHTHTHAHIRTSTKLRSRACPLSSATARKTPLSSCVPPWLYPCAPSSNVTSLSTCTHVQTQTKTRTQTQTQTETQTHTRHSERCGCDSS